MLHDDVEIRDALLRIIRIPVHCTNRTVQLVDIIATAKAAKFSPCEENVSDF